MEALKGGGLVAQLRGTLRILATPAHKRDRKLDVSLSNRWMTHIVCDFIFNVNTDSGPLNTEEGRGKVKGMAQGTGVGGREEVGHPEDGTNIYHSCRAIFFYRIF